MSLRHPVCTWQHIRILTHYTMELIPCCRAASTGMCTLSESLTYSTAWHLICILV